MKNVVIAIVFAVLVVPVFGQDANIPLYQSLDEDLGTTITENTTKLEEFDKEIVYNGQGKTYATYKNRYDALAKSLQESELRLSRLLEIHETPPNVKTERDRYDNLIKQMEQVKTEYGAWLQSVQ